jgi:hypothetical protein
MYTNIDTNHALSVISDFLRHSPICRDSDADPIIRALEIIMRNNLFKFGDTYWLQITGTAMGTPPACMYAVLYYGIHELTLIPQFKATVPFYKRYIDDVLGVWITDEDAETDERNWTKFQAAMPFGKLTWEFSPRTPSVNFLDLTLTLEHQRIMTRLYEKPLNLYLYIPPHSAHPPGILSGMITGYITRVFRLTSTNTDREATIRKFYRRLCDRGYTPITLRPLFHNALRRAQISRCKPIDDQEERIYLHLEYHPYDPSSLMERRRGLRSTGMEVPTGTEGVPTGTGSRPESGGRTSTSVPVAGLESAISNRHGGISRYRTSREIRVFDKMCTDKL